MEQNHSGKGVGYSRSLVLYRMFVKYYKANPTSSPTEAFIDFFTAFKLYRNIEDEIDQFLADEEEFKKAVSALLNELKSIAGKRGKKD